MIFLVASKWVYGGIHGVGNMEEEGEVSRMSFDNAE